MGRTMPESPLERVKRTADERWAKLNAVKSPAFERDETGLVVSWRPPMPPTKSRS